MFAYADPEQIAVMIPIVAILGGMGIAVVSIIMEGRKRDLEHKERIIAMEKGIPLPEQPEKAAKPVYSKRRAQGLVWFGIGLALTIALRVTPDADVAWGWGLVPLFIGAGLLIAATLDKKEYDANVRNMDRSASRPTGL